MQTTDSLNALNEQLLAAAAEFAQDAQALSRLLEQFVRDVERAAAEPLEIFPVAHHSPASALHMLQRLQANPPKALYIELCEDMLPLVHGLHECALPIALQAFGAESDTLPQESLPVSVVAPLTEASAEYQAIAYALTHPETKLVFVDRAVDYLFQWDTKWQQKPKTEDENQDAEPAADEAKMHGTAVGVSVGDLMPTFEAFLQFLLRNSNTRHFSEWWDQYVERTIIGADYPTYRQVMFLVGSLMRHLGRRAEDQKEDRLREQYMWTRMKQHMREHGIAPHEAIYICGAAHTASEVAEFGTANDLTWEIPPLSGTRWQYGLIPSSFAAIEYQFGHPPGTVSQADRTWEKSLKAADLTAINLQKPVKTKKKAAPQNSNRRPVPLAQFLTQPPEFFAADQEQLLDWCAQIVAMARANAYLASTADSIAIYETSMMLAQMRGRNHPSTYDFTDAAVTCLEKDRTPKKRNIAQLCQLLLGGDRVGKIGYKSLPPLVQNIFDRLAPLNISLNSTTNQRALMDFKSNPELRDCSDVLWKLRYLLGEYVVKPIMGERKLGFVPIQESWDVKIGKYQAQVIQLGYEGVVLEQVLEQRMKRTAFDEKATSAVALRTAEDALLYMNSPRLVRELGNHAATLLGGETGAEAAPEIFDRARRLVHYYRTTPNGLPDWLKGLVATGYAHYATLLPQAFADQGTKPEEIAGMLSFIFTLESLALSLGCQRSQLILGVEMAGREDVPPDKIGLLWTTEWLLGMRSVREMRGYFHHVLDDAIRLPLMPQYLNGFILSLAFAPGIARFVVELLSHIFAALPDQKLMPWLPALMIQLRQHQAVLQPLIKEASAVFPMSLAGFEEWKPQWLETDMPAAKSAGILAAVALSEEEIATRGLLFAAPESANAAALWLGLEITAWHDVVVDNGDLLSEDEQAVVSLLSAAPESMLAVAGWVG